MRADAPHEDDPGTNSPLRPYRTEILEAAREHMAASGRGALVVVYAGDAAQIVFYRASKDPSAQDPEDPSAQGARAHAGGATEHLDALRKAVQTYDPEREAVVLLADSLRLTFSCWIVGTAERGPYERLLWQA